MIKHLTLCEQWLSIRAA